MLQNLSATASELQDKRGEIEAELKEAEQLVVKVRVDPYSLCSHIDTALKAGIQR
jgi:hypothetical protein